MLLSNGSWNVVVLYTHAFRNDEHLTHEMQIKENTKYFLSFQ